ncbi:MAG: prepilin-type N-terminal cleavage/methylation domain-containing protein [Planctomycetales bacterium]|nr:prepilin-type N-terminal cleavage/methylation domain-containing protein [Planctomycetales bacterium]
MKRRRGISLIEMVVFVTIAATVMSSVLLCFNSLFRVQRQAVDAMTFNNSLIRLAAQWREDARLAVSAQIVDPDDKATATKSAPTQLLFTTRTGQTIKYAWNGHAVTRVAPPLASRSSAESDDSPESSDQSVPPDHLVPHFESYELASRSQVIWKLATADNHTIVSCQVLKAGAPDEAPQERLRIDAVVVSDPRGAPENGPADATDSGESPPANGGESDSNSDSALDAASEEASS